ncbi:Uncharacterised protein [Klebsiella pneumoniae]|uniref:Uncharacterized protein n=1 Tax=Klebsiella pneumoniae TaxID=573 RepID=A0A2X3GYB4_KLEPN|nr:Uncharacterised protein [Klebsiella pneumoniae]
MPKPLSATIISGRGWLEALRQAISAEKNVASLFQTVVIGKVNIVEISGNRCTLSVEFQVGGLYGVLFHVSYSNHKA